LGRVVLEAVQLEVLRGAHVHRRAWRDELALVERVDRIVQGHVRLACGYTGCVVEGSARARWRGRVGLRLRAALGYESAGKAARPEPVVADAQYRSATEVRAGNVELSDLQRSHRQGRGRYRACDRAVEVDGVAAHRGSAAGVGDGLGVECEGCTAR